MQIPDTVKYIVIGFMLFAAVAVDFVSKIMSIGFDLFFISIAVWVAWGMLKANKKEQEQNNGQKQ